MHGETRPQKKSAQKRWERGFSRSRKRPLFQEKKGGQKRWEKGFSRSRKRPFFRLHFSFFFLVPPAGATIYQKKHKKKSAPPNVSPSSQALHTDQPSEKAALDLCQPSFAHRPTVGEGGSGSSPAKLCTQINCQKAALGPKLAAEQATIQQHTYM